MISNKGLLALFLFAVLSIPATAGEKIEQFLKELVEGDISLSLYYQSFKGGEEETAFEAKYCEKNGWVPQGKNDKCIEFLRNRYNNRELEVSNFLQFLHKLIPKDHKSYKLECSPSPFTFEARRCVMTSNNNRIVFVEFNGGPRDGGIAIETINDVSTADYIEQQAQDE